MTISAAATASRRSWQIPSQHWFYHDRPHRNITHDHPAAWFGQICRILQEIAPFLRCNFFTQQPLRRVGAKMAIMAM
jgi:hypothetical protein